MYDLQDAFGSVSHSLIPICLKHYNVPDHLINNVSNLYSKLEGKVITKDWKTNFFKFRRGVFQGDPLSSIIFLIVFQPIISHIKLFEDKYGYDLNGTKIITAPFADDFEIITRHETLYQKLQDDIQKKICSMGLVLKPKKCRFLSVVSGSAKVVPFTLVNNSNPTNPLILTLKSLFDEPHKFLGSVLTRQHLHRAP